MIAYLPTPYPDELAFSWFSRYYIYAGCLTHKAALQELLARRCNTPSKEFLGQLNHGAKTAIQEVMPLEDAILKHTMFPQYARFLPGNVQKEALSLLTEEGTDPNRLFGIQPRAEQEQHFRYCPRCVAEDRAAYGETYWHRQHQIRGMTVCVKHRCRLHASAVSAKSELCFALAPAETCAADLQPTFVTDNALLSYAAYLEAVFNTPMDFSQTHSVRIALFQGLRKTKYLRRSGRSRYIKALVGDLQAYYKNIGIPQIATMSQVQRALLEGSSDFSVICQIAWFLGMRTEELTAPVLTEALLMQEASTHFIANAKPVDWEEYDRVTAPALERFAQAVCSGTVSAEGRPERLSEKMVYREMGLLGHQLENMPLCRAIFEKYTEPYPENWARRIIWAYQKLKKGGKTVYWSDIRKISGVKKKHFPEILPFLSLHTGQDTCAAIMQLLGKNP